MSKTLLMVGMSVGSILGGYVASWLGFGFLTYTSVLLSMIGSLLGIWVVYKLSK